jgi:hypothetical protein
MTGIDGGGVGSAVHDTVVGLLYCCLGVIRVVAVAVKVLLVGAVLLAPLCCFFLLDEFGFSRRSVLYRREYLTLVALDIALSQHFFLLVGYTIPGFGTALLAANSTTPTVSEYLSAWVTLSAPTGGLLVAVALAAYGTLGIAIVASLVVTTYDEVMRDFPRDDTVIQKEIANRTGRDVDDVALDQLDVEAVERYVETVVIASVQEKISSGHLGNPTFEQLWLWMRKRTPTARRHLDESVPLTKEGD